MTAVGQAWDDVVASSAAVGRAWLGHMRCIARAAAAECSAGFEEFVPALLAGYVAVDERAAGRILAEAQAVVALPRLAAAVDSGRMSPRAFSSVLEWLCLVDEQHVEGVADDLLARTASWGTRTPAQWAAAAKKALLAHDPEAELARRRLARRDRTARAKAAPHGMTWVSLLLDTADADEVMHALDAAADELGDAGADGEERGLANRRADAAVALITGRPARVGHQDDVAALGITEPLSSARPGAGPVQAEAPSAREVGGSETPAGAHRPRRRRGTRRRLADLVIPAASAVGAACEPAELRGHGAITPAQARELLAEGSEVRAVFVDACTGEPLAVGDRRWRVDSTDDLDRVLQEVIRSSGRTPVTEAAHDPSAALVRFLTVRDRTSIWPGSGVPASHCDLDHNVPHDRGGATSARNLGGLNRRAHRMKQRGWRWRRLDDGRVNWQAPGHRALYRPSPWQPPPRLPASRR